MECDFVLRVSSKPLEMIKLEELHKLSPSQRLRRQVMKRHGTLLLHANLHEEVHDIKNESDTCSMDSNAVYSTDGAQTDLIQLPSTKEVDDSIPLSRDQLVAGSKIPRDKDCLCFPLNSVNGFNAWNCLVHDVQYQHLYEQTLVKVDGKTPYDFVNNVMYVTIHVDLAKLMSHKGRKGKLCWDGTPLCTIMYSIIHVRFPYENDIPRLMREWFYRRRDRSTEYLKRRKKRKMTSKSISGSSEEEDSMVCASSASSLPRPTSSLQIQSTFTVINTPPMGVY